MASAAPTLRARGTRTDTTAITTDEILTYLIHGTNTRFPTKKSFNKAFIAALQGDNARKIEEYVTDLADFKKDDKSAFKSKFLASMGASPIHEKQLINPIYISIPTLIGVALSVIFNDKKLKYLGFAVTAFLVTSYLIYVNANNSTADKLLKNNRSFDDATKRLDLLILKLVNAKFSSGDENVVKEFLDNKFFKEGVIPSVNHTTITTTERLGRYNERIKTLISNEILIEIANDSDRASSKATRFALASAATVFLVSLFATLYALSPRSNYRPMLYLLPKIISGSLGLGAAVYVCTIKRELTKHLKTTHPMMNILTKLVDTGNEATPSTT